MIMKCSQVIQKKDTNEKGGKGRRKVAEGLADFHEGFTCHGDVTGGSWALTDMLISHLTPVFRRPLPSRKPCEA